MIKIYFNSSFKFIFCGDTNTKNPNGFFTQEILCVLYSFILIFGVKPKETYVRHSPLGLKRRILFNKSLRFEGQCFYNPRIFLPVKNCFQQRFYPNVDLSTLRHSTSYTLYTVFSESFSPEYACFGC